MKKDIYSIIHSLIVSLIHALIKLFMNSAPQILVLLFFFLEVHQSMQPLKTVLSLVIDAGLSVELAKFMSHHYYRFNRLPFSLTFTQRHI